ncbi:hypothetical protein PR202_ga07721 [Eleusine coracana subsp. coracana]|uniref:Mitochondrial pyruvate carrier n=1 Tax=Eleusine coracana subsp. coracana TaxID=191504 RepID=A0AAV5C0M7_ELECO|nr:hypothetical protein PR202_ga07721 [Eleusine coracana subsp. coracana]
MRRATDPNPAFHFERLRSAVTDLHEIFDKEKDNWASKPTWESTGGRSSALVKTEGRQADKIHQQTWLLPNFKQFGTIPLAPKQVRFSHSSFPFHFWAPTFKWCLNIANVADFTKPPEEVSYPQQLGKLDI